MIFISIGDLSREVEHLESICRTVESLHRLVHYSSQQSFWAWEYGDPETRHSLPTLGILVMPLTFERKLARNKTFETNISKIQDIVLCIKMLLKMRDNHLEGSFKVATSLDDISNPGEGVSGVGWYRPGQVLPVSGYSLIQQVLCYRYHLSYLSI